MAWTKTETLSNTPDSLGRKNVIETWSLKDRDGVAVATITKDANDAVTLNVSGQLKVYRALLTQSGTDAPVATVLENTLGGTVVWSRTNAGVYQATLTGAFEGSTRQTNYAGFNVNAGNIYGVVHVDTSANVNTIQSFAAADLTTAADDVLVDFPLTIIVDPS